MFNKQTLKCLTLAVITSQTLVAAVHASSNLSRAEGVVTDSQSNLQWQDNYDNNAGEVKSGSFIEATEYCSKLDLLGKQDWRLPTQDELLTTVDKSRADDNQPAIKAIFEMVLVEEGYLSTTNYEDDSETVWLVDYTHGESQDVALINTDGYHIRCVRAK